MVLVSEIKSGATIKFEGKLYKVLEVIRHTGSGQMHGFIELKLKDLQYGHFADRHFKFSDKIEEVETIKRQMEYIYTTGEDYYFMDPESFEQIPVTKQAVGDAQRFLKEGTKVVIESLNGFPISMQFPKTMELAVVSTGPGKKEAQDNTMKPATLENGLDILVPQFIETGDLIRLDTEKIKYIDRVPNKKI
jgi:elongation factor P